MVSTDPAKNCISSFAAWVYAGQLASLPPFGLPEVAK